MAPGINSKMNEMQAALGLLQLQKHPQNIHKRNEIANIYRTKLKDIEGIKLMDVPKNLSNNSHSYFPVFVETLKYGKNRDELYNFLKENDIYGRRYFYPLISHFPTYKGLTSSKPENLPNAERISQEVICLPIYPSMDIRIAKGICDLIKEFKK